jgi:hypothetical protein
VLANVRAIAFFAASRRRIVHTSSVQHVIVDEAVNWVNESLRKKTKNWKNLTQLTGWPQVNTSQLEKQKAGAEIRFT